MNILLYDYHELEERQSKRLSVWKAWHTILFICAAVFGILNYSFLQSTMQLVDNNCVFYPRALEFHWVELPNNTMNTEQANFTEESSTMNIQLDITGDEIITDNKLHNVPVEESATMNSLQSNNTAAESTTVNSIRSDNAAEESIPMNTAEEGSSKNINDEAKDKTNEKTVSNNNRENLKIVRREATDSNETEIEYISKDFPVITANSSHRLMLFAGRTIFGRGADCQFAEFMPLLSTVFALVWVALFVMCPGSERTSAGLPQPWRILPPALAFALVLVALTGYSFVTTNSGLHAFCAAFHNYTNATTCSPVSQFLEHGWNASWSFGERTAATRAAAAGVWGCWACAAALLLARCLAAPDFALRRTGVYLVRDPDQKVSPYLRKSQRHSQRSSGCSPIRVDTISLKSEPTVTTEVLSASVDHGPHSDPTSLATTPVKVRSQ